MITAAKLRRKPRHFQAFTGVSVAEFDQLLAQVEPAYEADQQRVRIGAGRPFYNFNCVLGGENGR